MKKSKKEKKVYCCVSSVNLYKATISMFFNDTLNREIDIVDDYKEMIHKIKNDSYNPSLIIADNINQGTTLYDFCKWLNDNNYNIPILISHKISTFNTEKYNNAYKNIIGILQKPFEQKTIINLIKKIIE